MPGLLNPIEGSYLKLSLRTDLPFAAAHRVNGIHAYVADVERRAMAGELTENQIRVLMSEGLRAELNRIIRAEAANGLCDDEIDARIAALEAENRALRRKARHDDFADVADWLIAAADRAGIPRPGTIDPELGRTALKLKRDIGEVAIAILDGDPVEEAAADLVKPYSAASLKEFLGKPVTLSAAIAKTADLYQSKDMQGNIKTCGDLLLARFGDIPIGVFDKDMLLAFFTWGYRLPKSHGKRTNGPRLTKDQEIDKADSEDEHARAEVLAIPGLSTEERRLRLAEKLKPRLTVQTIKRYRDSVNRVFKAAAKLGVRGLISVPGYTEVEKHLTTISDSIRKEDALYVHVSKPKNRTPWSEERLALLFESSIYRGCASSDRRWVPGNLVVRDALYWVPLLLGTIGTRIKELLQLGPGDLRQRNGVLCLAIAMGPAKPGKTPDSTRYVPVPQVVLDLGFAEWVVEMASKGEIMLFPEVARRADRKGSSLTDAFYRIRDRAWMHLGIQDHEEDCYALRKTLQTLLEAQGVGDGRRQALAGHKNQSTINRHYTALHMRSIKADVDRVGYRIVVDYSAVHGFPIIERCAIADDLPEAKLNVGLGERGISYVEITAPGGRMKVECDDLTPGELAAALPIEMAERLAGEDFQRPQRGPRAELADQLCAFAAVRVGSVHAVSRRKAVEAELRRPVRSAKNACAIAVMPTSGSR